MLTALFIIAAACALVWLAGSLLTLPYPSRVAPARPPARDFDLTTADGLTLSATYWPGKTPNAPAVLLLHGDTESRAITAPNAAWFAREGYAALTFDFRGHGESARASRSFGWLESRDARAAFEWLKAQQNHAPVAAIGISLGGAACLLGEEGPLPAETLVLQAVYPDIRRAVFNRVAALTTRGPARLLEPLLTYQAHWRYGVSPARIAPVEALRNYRGPVLIIGGEADRSTPPDETCEMYDAAPGRKELWFVTEAECAMPVSANRDWRQRLRDIILRLTGSAEHREVCDLISEDYRRRVLAFLQGTIGRA